MKVIIMMSKKLDRRDFLKIAAKMRTLPKGGAVHAWPMVRLGQLLGM